MGEIEEDDLLAGSGVGIQLKSKSRIGSEGVGMEVREALGDIRGRKSEAEVLDRTVQRSCFGIQFLHVLLLLRREYDWDRIRVVLVVALPTNTSYYVCCPC